MIDADDHDFATTAQVLAVIRRQLLRRACFIAATVEPDHHRPLAAIVSRRCPQVESQTVFARMTVIPVEQECEPIGSPSAAHGLRTYRPVAHRRANLRPWRHGRRRQEARFAPGRTCVRNAFESEDAVAHVAANLARGSLDDSARRRRDRGLARALAYRAERNSGRAACDSCGCRDAGELRYPCNELASRRFAHDSPASY